MPARVYVITVESCQVNKEDSDDITDRLYGVLRIFANKEDAMKYMRDYYDNLEAEDKSFKTYENSSGLFSVKMYSETANHKGAISMNGTDLGKCIQKDVLECRVMDVSQKLDHDTMTPQDDFYEEFFG